MTLEVGLVIKFTLSLKFDSNFCAGKCSVYARSILGKYMIIENVINEDLFAIRNSCFLQNLFSDFCKMKFYSARMVLTFLVIYLSDLTQGKDEGIDIL